jgi:hypothetical protein
MPVHPGQWFFTQQGKKCHGTFIWVKSWGCVKQINQQKMLRGDLEMSPGMNSDHLVNAP